MAPGFLSVVTVEPVLFLYMLSSFWQFALYQDLVYQKVCSSRYDAITVCADLHNASNAEALSWVQGQTSYWFLVCNVALVLPSVLCVLYLGAWGDRHGGRKATLYCAPLGGLLSTAVYIWMDLDTGAHVGWVVLANFASGACGGFVASIMTCMSYVAGISEESQRTVRVSRLQAMTFTGGMLGSFISGALKQQIGSTWSFAILAADHIVNIAYITWVVPQVNPLSGSREEDEAEGRRASCCVRYFRLGHLKDGVRTVIKARGQGQRVSIIMMLLCLIIVLTTISGESDMTFLFIKDKPLAGSYETYSYYIGFKNGMGALMLLVGMPLLNRFALHDTTVCCIGLASRIAALVLLGLSTNTIMLFFVPVLSIFSEVSVPSIRSNLSKLVLPTEQAKIFSFVAVIEAFSTILASAIYNSAYPATRSFFNGCMFEVAAGVLLLPLVIVSWLYRIRGNPYESLEIDTEETSSSSDSQGH